MPVETLIKHSCNTIGEGPHWDENFIMPVETLIKNSCNTIGEGPHWDKSNGTLLYVDINDGVIHRWNSKTGVDETHKFDTFVGFIVPRKKGGYVVGLGQDICVFDWDTKQLTVLHTVDQGKQTRLNDGKCDPAGRLWCGTMGLEKQAAQVEPNQGSLYCVDVDGTLTKKKDGVSISNGLAWTADKKTMYYIDSIPRKVYGYDYDLATGNISNERIIVDLKPTPLDECGFPDGMTIDTEDKIWVACYLAAKVLRFDPATGKEIVSVAVPAKRTTSCCFGGPNFDEMFITCGRYGVTPEEEATYPLAGSVFKATGIGAKGLPAPVFLG